MLFMVVILFNFILLSSATCPPGSVTFFKDKTHCLIFEKNKTYYLDAEETCINLGGHLASVHDSTNNMFLAQQALVKFTDSTDSDFWFGANDLSSPQKWSWMDDTPFDYSNWDNGRPLDTEGNECGTVLMHGGKWKSDDCYKTKPFVCMINDPTAAPTTITTSTKPTSCQPSWTYYVVNGTTGYCYKVEDSATWYDAEDRCRIYDAHLASIHDLDENLFVANLAYYNGVEGCSWTEQAWIGLFTEDDEVHWNWTDKSLFNYTNWWPEGPHPPSYKENCCYMFLAPCSTTYIENTGNIMNAPCSQVLSKFVCKKLPS